MSHGDVTRPKLGDATSGRPVPPVPQRAADSPRVRIGLQAPALLAALFVLAVALSGPDETPRNLAPWALYVTSWVGLVPASLLLGPVWRVLKPLRLLARALPGCGRLPGRCWSSSGWSWCLPAGRPRRWSPASWSATPCFEVYSTLLGRLSAWGRRDDDRVVLRSPLANAMAIPPERGLAAVVVVLLGSTAFDGLTRTAWWQTDPGAGDDVLSGTLGLLAMTALVAGLYTAGTRLSARMGRLPGREFPRLFAATVVPIALGYTIAHYFSLFVLDGQTFWMLLDNPFGAAGVDLFGAYGNVVDLTAVSPDAIAYVQVGAVVTGHVVGVTLAHERALRLAPRAPASDQLPLVLVMIVFTIGGLGLPFGF